jgi:RNase P/RNase MRP subunit POP5
MVSTEREFGHLTARVDVNAEDIKELRTEVAGMRTDIREVRDALVSAQGGYKVLVIVVGLAGTVGAIAAKAATFIAFKVP